MCGRFLQLLDPALLEALFGIPQEQVSWPARYNLAPSQRALVIVGAAPRRPVMMTWGFEGYGAYGPMENRPINARSETVADKPMFRHAVRHRRCLVPAEGYYEWESTTPKTPWLIRPAENSQPFAFAGLYTEPVINKTTGEETPGTFAILTRQASDTLTFIHHRMPVAVPAELWGPWLDPKVTDAPTLLRSVLERPVEPVRMHRVDRRVGSVHNEGPSLIAAVPPPEPERGLFG